jgi:nitroimidazol reductase NimA-like FMN-containing flavoprotein (pyridoxamine 5'-phosphate oxidase superfamily)
MARPDFEVSAKNRILRAPRRARYDRATVHGILDAGLVAHVGFVERKRPMVIPMAFARVDEVLYLHGSRRSRLMNTASGHWTCVALTITDGIVFARSLFDSSLNYRSVVIHGEARPVTRPDEMHEALIRIAERYMPGRTSEVRPMLPGELRATAILAVPIAMASAKVRSGAAEDGAEREAPETWAGVVPLTCQFGAPIADPTVPGGVEIPASVRSLLARQGG